MTDKFNKSVSENQKNVNPRNILRHVKITTLAIYSETKSSEDCIGSEATVDRISASKRWYDIIYFAPKTV